MMNWDQIGKYCSLFLADGVAGYFLQFIAYSLAIHAFNKLMIKPLRLFVMALTFSILAFGIKKLPINIDIILIMIACILLSYLLFKTNIYSTVLAVLLTALSVLIFELVTYGIANLIFGTEKFNYYFYDKSSIDNLIIKALIGIPTNIFLIIEMIFVYKIIPSKLKKGVYNGEDSKENS
ncbi:MAG: hypothetical protein A2Y15_02965 [Clostridiales bacterium GWF2_36_10]|nr:MAG: hypothetical protein A2Y15_02965 [Clostridiales bacterium GWF2_36_10]HAN20936.1 hypothetical protein [Clostridiales bacterium]